MPLLAPVITNVRPACEGKSFGVHLEVVMSNNVLADNTVVNVYIARYPLPVAVTPRPYHHGNLRAALLEQAERALADGGDLSLRELARQVGVSHAAPRRHFADKQTLLDALAEDGFERLGAALQTAMAEADDFDGRLLAFARAYVRFATEHAALLELMFAGKHRPGAAASLREAADRAFEAPLALIAEGQAAGEVTPGDPERVALVAWATLQGLATMINSQMLPPDMLDDIVAVAVEQICAGLRPR
jgi:AcrR family transcriptional regulator